MRFKRVYVEILNVCNLQCSFCSPMTRPKRIMTPEEFDSIAKELRPYTDFLYLHVKGEPLMHPQLGEILDICKRLAFHVNLTTNGVLIGEKGHLLLENSSVRQVNFSVHSYTQQASDVRKMYLDHLLSFGKAAVKQERPFVVYRMWNMGKGGWLDTESLSVLKQIQDLFRPDLNLPDAMNHGKSVTLDKGLFISWEEKFKWPSLRDPFLSDTGRCYGARDMLGILCDGTVVPCCLDANGEASFGNAFERPLEDIVLDSELNAVFKGFLEGRVLLELCQKCTYRTRFDRNK